MDVALERGPLHAVDRDGEPVSGEEGLALQRRGGGTLLRRRSGWAARSAGTRSACACAGVQVHAQVQGAAHAGTTGNWLRVALPMPPRPTCTCLRLMSSGLWPMPLRPEVDGDGHALSIGLDALDRAQRAVDVVGRHVLRVRQSGTLEEGFGR